MRKFKTDTLDLVLFQNFDAPNTFNDWICIVDWRAGRITKYRCTGEAGDWSGYKKKYRWRSRWLPGQYKNVYKIGRFLDGPALKMQGQVELYNLENDTIQRGGGCHLHWRRSTRDSVANSSAGCIVPFKQQDTVAIVDACKQSGKKSFTLTVFMANEFPQLKGV